MTNNNVSGTIYENSRDGANLAENPKNKATHTHEEKGMMYDQDFENYVDEMAEEHVHVAESLHNGDLDSDEPEDDGQPTEYEEWQDYMGGDDWDHGQYDDLGY